MTYRVTPVDDNNSMKETTMTKEDQPEFVGFPFMGDVIEHCDDVDKAYQLAILNGFSEKQAQIICEEVEKKSK